MSLPFADVTDYYYGGEPITLCTSQQINIESAMGEKKGK